MVRKKLAAVVAAMGVLQAGYAMALGLGEFSLHSSLNQPLDGEIKLLNIGELSNAELIVKLASADDFKRVGASRDFFLTNIDFEVEVDQNGNGIIKLTTREKVSEPYLNFLVEARWPSGKLLREYTVLLDLPVFSESAAPVVQAPVPAKQAQAASAPVSSPKRVASAPATSSRQTLSEGALQSGSSYRVKQGDTLWKVASKSRPGSGVSVEQTIVSIQRLNPNAFMRGNINNLKAGYILRLPTESEVKEISSAVAQAEVANQNRAWRKGDAPEAVSKNEGAQLDATSTDAPSSNVAAEEPRLSLSANGTDDSAGVGDGEGDGSGTDALRNRAEMAEENLDKTERDNQELQSRLEDMESKLATMQRLIELKDDQLAAMQGSTGEQSSQTASAAPVVEEEAPKSTPAEKPATPAKAKFVSKPAPKPEAGIFENPLYMVIGAIVALLAVVLVVVRRRKSGNEEVLEQVEESTGTDEVVATENTEESAEESEPVEDTLEEASVGDFAEESFTESESVLQESADGSAATEEPVPVQSETGDAIAEADIYIAYGRYQQAADLLNGAIDQEPERSDLQLKLLEVYIETRDKAGFQQRYGRLQALGDESAVAEVKELLSTVEGVSDWLDDLSPAATSDVSDNLNDMDADLIEGGSFDGADFDIALDSDSPTLETEAITDADLLDEELDLNLDDADLDTQKTVQFEAVDLELDLDEEFDVSTTGEDELNLDLDLNEGTETGSADIQSEEGFELDLDGDDDLDLELGELSLDTDLDELEAEFDAELEETGSVSVDIADEGGEAEVELSESTELEPELDLELGEDAEPEIDLDLGDDFALDDASGVDVTAEVEDGLDYEPPQSSDDAEQPVASDKPAEESFDTDVEQSSEDEDFDFLSDTDEVATKLDLARAYIDMGDTEGARDILDEVVQEGDDTQKQEASSLLERI